MVKEDRKAVHLLMMAVWMSFRMAAEGTKCFSSEKWPAYIYILLLYFRLEKAYLCKWLWTFFFRIWVSFESDIALYLPSRVCVYTYACALPLKTSASLAANADFQWSSAPVWHLSVLISVTCRAAAQKCACVGWHRSIPTIPVLFHWKASEAESFC